MGHAWTGALFACGGRWACRENKMSEKIFPLWLLSRSTLMLMVAEAQAEIDSPIKSEALSADAEWLIAQIDQELSARDENEAEAGIN